MRVSSHIVAKLLIVSRVSKVDQMDLKVHCKNECALSNKKKCGNRLQAML